MNSRQRPPARPTRQAQKRKENVAYYTVVGVSLALIAILAVMLVLKLGQKKPAATETEAGESLDFTLAEVLPDDDLLSTESSPEIDTAVDPLPAETTETDVGPVIVTNPGQVTVAPDATTAKEEPAKTLRRAQQWLILP